MDIDQPEAVERLSSVVARMVLVALPEPIREAFERRAAEIEYPVGQCWRWRWLVFRW